MSLGKCLLTLLPFTLSFETILNQFSSSEMKNEISTKKVERFMQHIFCVCVCVLCFKN